MPWEPVLEKKQGSGSLILMANGKIIDKLDTKNTDVANLDLQQNSIVDDSDSGWLATTSGQGNNISGPDTDTIFNQNLSGDNYVEIEISVSHAGCGSYGSCSGFEARYNGVDTNRTAYIDYDGSGKPSVTWTEEVKVPQGGSDISLVLDGGPGKYNASMQVKRSLNANINLQTGTLEDFTLQEGETLITSSNKSYSILPNREYTLDFEIEAGKGEDAGGNSMVNGSGANGARAKGSFTITDSSSINVKSTSGEYASDDAGSGGAGIRIEDDDGNIIAEVGGGGGGATNMQFQGNCWGTDGGKGGGNPGGSGGVSCQNGADQDGEPGDWNSESNNLANVDLNRSDLTQDGENAKATLKVTKVEK